MGRSSILQFKKKKGRFSANHFQTPWFELGFQLWEPIDHALIKAIWVEFMCMVLFLYVATGVVVFGCRSSDVGTKVSTGAEGETVPEDCFLNQSRVLTIATGFGLAIFVLVYLAAGFSGGHINPAVTLAFLITRKVSVLRAVLYWIVQLGGAIVGSVLVEVTDRTGYDAAGGGANRLIKGLPPGAGWLMECILTFVLVLVVFAATDTARAQSTSHLPVLAPLAIGFAVFAAHLTAIAIDGCSINPARSFGPAVIRGDFQDLWIFFAGPLSGAAIAALVYEITLRPSRELILPIDHVAKDGQHAQPSKLPGYAGVQGLHDAVAVHHHGGTAEGAKVRRGDTAHEEHPYQAPPGTQAQATNGNANGVTPGVTDGGRGRHVV